MKRLALILLTLAFAAPLRAQGAWPDDRTGRMIERYLEVLSARPVEGEVFRSLATLYDSAGRLDDLDARLDRLVTADPAKAEVLLILRGHLGRYRGRLEEARAFYEKAIALNARSYVSRISLARTLSELGQARPAESAWRDALGLVDGAGAFGLDVRDETTQICRALGRIAMNAGRPADARAWWNKLVEIDPGDLSRREELARILVENRLYDDAVKALEALMERAANAPEQKAKAAREIGRVLDAAGRADDALAAYARALALTAPGNWLRRQVRADVFDLSERAGKVPEIEKSLAAETAAAPDDAEAWQELLRARERLGDRAGVASAWENLLRLRPDDAALRRRRATDLADAGAWKESADAWREVVRRDAKDAKARLELARALKAAGDAAGSAGVLDAAAGDFAHDPVTLVEIARAFEAADNPARAEDVLRRAVAAAPDDIRPVRELGEFLRRRGRADEAARALKEFADARAKSSDALTAVGRMFRDLGLADDALAALRKAAALSPADDARWKDLAQAALEADRFDEGASAWEEAARRATSDKRRDEAWEQVISIYQSRERLADLVKTWRDALAKSPDDESAALRLGKALDRTELTGASEEAVRVYTDFLGRKPDRPAVMLALARAQTRLGRDANALKLYERLLAVDVRDARRTLTEIITLHVDAGRAPDALAAAKRLVEMFPLDPSAHAELARTQEALGNDAEAAAAYTRALELRPGDRPLTEALARVLENAGDTAALTELHRRTLRSNPGRDACLASVRALLRLSVGTGEFEAVGRLLEGRLAQDRGNFTWRLALAEFYRADEKPERVEPLLSEALDVAPPASRDEVLEALSRQAEEMGDAAGAIRWTEEMKRAAGGTLPREALPRLAALYLAAGRIADGRGALETWWRADAQNPEVHRQAAEICRRHGDLKGAIEALERLVALPMPPDASPDVETERLAARMQIADLCERVGRRDDAARICLDILENVPGLTRPKPGAQRDAPAMPAGVFAAPVDPGPMPPPPPPVPVPGRGPAYGEVRLKAIEALVRIYLDGNRIDELIGILEKRIATDPTRMSYHDDLAQVLQLAGEPEKLLKALERACRTFPNSFEYARDLARVYARAGRAADALSKIDAAIALAPDQEPSFQGERIGLWLKLDRPDDVRKFVKDLVEKQRDVTRAQESAERCAQEGAYELAAGLFDDRIASSPNADASSRLAAARWWKRAGRPEEARRDAKAYLDATRNATPNDKDLPTGAALLTRAQAVDAVVQALGAADAGRLHDDLLAESERKPDDVARLIELMALQGRLGRTTAMTRTCRRLTALRPDARLITSAVRDLRENAHGDEARALLRWAIEDPAARGIRDAVAREMIVQRYDPGPDDALARLLVDVHDRSTAPPAPAIVAQMLWDRGQRDDAIRRMRAVVAEVPTSSGRSLTPPWRSPTDAVALLTLSGMLRASGKDDEARALAARAAESAALPPPETPVEGVRSAYAERRGRLAGELLNDFSEHGALNELRERLAKRLAASPDDPTAHYDLAALDERAGRRDAALETIEKLLARKPDDPAVRRSAAEMLQDLGRHQEAIAEFARLASRRPPQREAYERWSEALSRAGDRAGSLEAREKSATIFREPALLADVAREWQGMGMEDRARVVYRRYLWLQHGPSALWGGEAPAAGEYAKFLRQAGRFEQAARILERAIAVARLRGTDVDVKPLRLDLADDYQSLGRLDEFIRRQQARAAAPGADPSELDFLATLHAKSGDDDRAVATLREIARVRPRDVNNLLNLVQTLRRARRLDEAIDACRRLLEADPGNAASALTAIAEMHYEKGETARAVEAARMMLLDRYASDRDESDRLPSVAYLYGRMGLADLEIETWRRVVAVSRGASGRGRAELVRALSERGRTSEACEAALTGLAETTDAPPRAAIVRALFSSRDAAGLIESAERALRVEDVASDAELAEHIEQTLFERLLQLRRADLAVDVLTRMWHERRGGSDAAHRAASGLVELGRFAEAEAVEREVLRGNPGDPVALLSLARAQAAAGKLDEAERTIDEVLRRSPDSRVAAAAVWSEQGLWTRALARLGTTGEATESFDAAVLRAEALSGSGQPDRAAAAWEGLLRRFPSEGTFLSAGRFYLASGRLERAETALREFQRINPASFEGARMLGRALREAGKFDEAERVLDTAALEGAFDEEIDRVRRESGRPDASGRAEAERALVDADADWARRTIALAEALAAEGRRDEAAALYRKLATLARDATMRRQAAERLAVLEANRGN